MPEAPKYTYNILPEDRTNFRVILKAVGQTTDEAKIREIVAGYLFSSPEAAKHTADGIVKIAQGVLKSVKSIEFSAVDIDAHAPKTR